MTVQLAELLERVLDGAPPLGDDIDAVFAEAERLRRRRARTLLTAGATGVVAVAVAGYLLASFLLPATVPPAPSTTVPPLTTHTTTHLSRTTTPPDPVLSVLAPLVQADGFRIGPRTPARGDGWRQYVVTTADGRDRGVVVAAVYAVREELCFPVSAESDDCADARHAPGKVRYMRYDKNHSGWPANETIARRPDGRTVALMAVGDSGTQQPPLTGDEVKQAATGPRLAAAFGPAESCAGAAGQACPSFRVPVPVPDDDGN